jgi:5'-methylthioadenosine phosphorylase
MESVRIAVIGGSGLYSMPEVTDIQEHAIDTPFGSPSDKIIVGNLQGQRVAFLPRHGRGHVHTPSEVPYRANLYALKSIGVTHIIAVSACGSLKEELAPGHIVIPDQLFDFTKDERGRTFFGDGLVAHVGVADPFCPSLSMVIADACAEAGGIVHYGGTSITIEGPRFSTKGESHVWQQLGFSIIGMTTSPEAYLAREAEMHYAVMAHVNQDSSSCACESALAQAFATARDRVSPALRQKLQPIIGKYFQA